MTNELRLPSEALPHSQGVSAALETGRSMVAISTWDDPPPWGSCDAPRGARALRRPADGRAHGRELGPRRARSGGRARRSASRTGDVPQLRSDPGERAEQDHGGPPSPPLVWLHWERRSRRLGSPLIMEARATRSRRRALRPAGRNGSRLLELAARAYGSPHAPRPVGPVSGGA